MNIPLRVTFIFLYGNRDKRDGISIETESTPQGNMIQVSSFQGFLPSYVYSFNCTILLLLTSYYFTRQVRPSFTKVMNVYKITRLERHFFEA